MEATAKEGRPMTGYRSMFRHVSDLDRTNRHRPNRPLWPRIKAWLPRIDLR
jgi:hypothetical protein